MGVHEIVASISFTKSRIHHQPPTLREWWIVNREWAFNEL